MDKFLDVSVNANPSSAPPYYNQNYGLAPGGQKTFGKPQAGNQKNWARGKHGGWFWKKDKPKAKVGQGKNR